MKKDNSTIPMDDIVSESTQIFPLVSIGIPVYNAENTIAACIESALAQNYANFEILIYSKLTLTTFREFEELILLFFNRKHISLSII